MRHAPDVAQVGTADYASIALDPILSAQMSLLTYSTGKTHPDWERGYKAMAAELGNAPLYSFSVDSQSTSSNVSHTWASGSHSGLFGLWGGSTSEDQYSRKFADSTFSVDASFQHLLPFQTNAGAWYESAALGLAFHNHNSPPWRPDAVVTWDNTFGSQGNLQRVTANILVADTMNVRVVASTSFTQEEQQTILNNKNSGMWPFYTSNGSTGVTTKVEFDDHGRITITTTSAAGVPVVVGANVLQMSDFVGFTMPALESRVPSLV
jgi:hypothetical protein